MSTLIQCGKPDVGNSYMRLDSEVSPEKPVLRRKDRTDAIETAPIVAIRHLIHGVLALAFLLQSAIAFGNDIYITDKIKAAQNGSANAQYELGKCYYLGEGVATNEVEAMKWLRRAAENGHAKAQDILGVVYCDGIGVEKNLEEGRCWLRKAADNGNADAQSRLGAYCFADRDYVNAASWYHKAAENGDAIAQCAFGVMCKSGIGVKANVSEAIKWLQKASDQGLKEAKVALAEAQFQLGKKYFNGESVDKDDAKAALWIRKAAENGIVEAQYAFGLMCKNGVGVGADHMEAIKWLSKASEQGHKEARNTLSACRAELAGAGRNELQGHRSSSEQGDFEDGVRQGAQLLSLLLNLQEAQRQNEQVYNPMTGNYMKRSEFERYKQIYNDQRIREQSRDDYRSGFPMPISN